MQMSFYRWLKNRSILQNLETQPIYPHDIAFG